MCRQLGRVRRQGAWSCVLQAVCQAADTLRERVKGKVVSYGVNRCVKGPVLARFLDAPDVMPQYGIFER